MTLEISRAHLPNSASAFVNVHCHSSFRFVALKYEFPQPERAALANHCLEALQVTGFDISLQTKLATTAADLLAYGASFLCGLTVISKKKLQLVVQWEPLFDLLTQLLKTTRSEPYEGAAAPG